MHDATLDLLRNAQCCFWFGLPPCPKCGTDHGDPAATAEYDRQLRHASEGLEPCSQCGKEHNHRVAYPTGYGPLSDLSPREGARSPVCAACFAGVQQKVQNALERREENLE